MRNRIITVVAVVLFGVLILAVCWPRGIRIVSQDGSSVAGLKVSLLQANTWDNEMSDEEGYAEFGRGLWRVPWQDRPKMVAVFDGDKIIWEGVLNPNCLGVVEIPVQPRRTRK